MTERFATPQERAAAIAFEALRRGLWDNPTALAFVAYVDDTDRLDYWETALRNLVDLEDEAQQASRAVEAAEDAASAAYDRVRAQQNRCREVEVQTGMVTTGRTAMFGDLSAEMAERAVTGTILVYTDD